RCFQIVGTGSNHRIQSAFDEGETLRAFEAVDPVPGIVVVEYSGTVRSHGTFPTPLAPYGWRRHRALTEQLVGDAVVQRAERSVDDVGGDADRAPALAMAVGALDHHPRDRTGAGVRREDADLVVDQPHVLELRIDREQRLAQRR